jgi:hypothetical protein
MFTMSSPGADGIDSIQVVSGAWDIDPISEMRKARRVEGLRAFLRFYLV